MTDGVDWPERPRLVVLTGYAGSGKTELLSRLATRGEQVMDLEALANHRGSAFGGLGRARQPSHRQFGAAVYAAWRSTDPDRVLWMEDEGAFLGSVGVPSSMQRALAGAPGVEVIASADERLARLRAEYGDAPRAAMLSALARTARRLGSLRTRIVRDALVHGRLDAALSTLMSYYDEGYAKRRARAGRTIVRTFERGESIANLISNVSERIIAIPKSPDQFVGI